MGIAAVATVLASAMSMSLATVDIGLLGRWMRAHPVRPVPKIVVFTIPSTDVEVLQRDRPPGCTCPLIPRTLLADTVNKLREDQASAIVLDLILDTPCLVHDHFLDEAMKRAGDVILATNVYTSGVSNRAANGYTRDVTNLDTNAYTRDVFNLELVPPPADIHGYRIAASPAVDGVFGRVMAVETVQGALYRVVQTEEGQLTVVSNYRLPMGLATWCVLHHEPTNDLSLADSGDVRVGGMKVPIIDNIPPSLLDPLLPRPGPADEHHAVPIRWYGPAGTFKTIPIQSLLAGAVSPAEIRGAVAVVGEEKDQKMTLVGPMSGPEVQANVIATFLGKRWLRPLSAQTHWAIIFLAALLAAVGMTALPGTGGVLVSCGLAVLATCTGRWLIASDRWLLVGPVLVGVAISGATSMVVDRLKSNRSRRWMARELELRDEVASEVAHDMRGHLAALAQTMDLVLRRLSRFSDDAVDPRAMDVLRRQLRALEHEVSTLMDADPDRQLHARRAPVELLELVRNTAEDVQASTHGHTIRVTGTPAVVAGDQGMLSRAVWNLLSNAVKYSPNGGEIRARVGSANGMVTVAVSDEGIGIRAEDMPKLFTRFGRAVPEDMHIPGTGLGLYSVQRTVQAHHGHVTVESRVKAGSTFTVWLPAQRPLSEASEDDYHKPT